MWQHGSVPSAPPPGDPAPTDGRLPEQALAQLGEQPFGLYVHVPFCRVRCGYCDFNTYTAEELGPGASPDDVRRSAIDEIRLARRVLGDVDLPVSTVFLGGGTPTLLPPADLAAVLASAAAEFGLAADAEVTTEANPDSVTRWDLEELRGVGIHPDLLRDAVGGAARAGHARPDARPAAGPGRRGVGARGGLRAGEPGPDLRHAGGVAAGLGDLARRRPRVRARPRVGLRADRRGRHRPRPRRTAGRAAGARRRRPRGQVPPRRRAARGRRARAGTRSPTGRGTTAGPLPPQPPLLDRRGLVGRRARGALPRRRRPVVERQAPRGVRRAAGAAATARPTRGRR